MPGNAMSARETWQVVAFVRSLGRVKREPLPGDAARGAQVYEAVGCAACHTIRGRGGPIGPDLTDVGARSSPAYLRRAIVDPQADVPSGFKQVRAVTRDGRRLIGVRVNEDTFSIQFRDARRDPALLLQGRIGGVRRGRRKNGDAEFSRASRTRPRSTTWWRISYRWRERDESGAGDPPRARVRRRTVGAADLRPHPPGGARAGQLADLSRHLRRATILRARRDQPRECAAAAPGLDLPGSGTPSLREPRRWCSTA